MRRRSKNSGYIFLIKRKFILGAILLSVVLYALAGTGGFGSVEAGDQAESEVKNRGSDQAASWQTIRMRVTAYCPCRRCCGKNSDGITANGHRMLRSTQFYYTAENTEKVAAYCSNVEPDDQPHPALSQRGRCLIQLPGDWFRQYAG